jgi:hypothetical protein
LTIWVVGQRGSCLFLGLKIFLIWNPMFKILNPHTNEFFGGMHPNGKGGHIWSANGRAFESRKAAMISFHVAFLRIPADFLMMEFDEQGHQLNSELLKHVLKNKKKLIHPDDKDYDHYVHSHIRHIAKGEPFFDGQFWIH